MILMEFPIYTTRNGEEEFFVYRHRVLPIYRVATVNLFELFAGRRAEIEKVPGCRWHLNAGRALDEMIDLAKEKKLKLETHQTEEKSDGIREKQNRRKR